MSESTTAKKNNNLTNTLGVYLLIGLALAMAAAFLVIKPQLATAGIVSGKVKTENQTLDGLKKLQTDTATLRTNYQDIKNRRDAILAQLPAKNEEERLVALLSDLAQQSGVVLSTFVPQGTPALAAGTPSSLTTYPASVTVTGNYASIQAFYQAVETSARFIDVQAASVSSSATNPSNPSINAQLTLQAYYQTPAPVATGVQP